MSENMAKDQKTTKSSKKESTRVADKVPEKTLVADPEIAYASMQQHKVIDLMGMSARKSSTQINQDAYYIDLIRKGIPKSAIDHLMTRTGLSTSEMADILHVSERTLHRREPSELLNAEQSEKMIELARLYAKGHGIFGTMENFNRWMNDVIPSLGHIRPKELLDTSMGFQILLDELGRIEYGVYS